MGAGKRGEGKVVRACWGISFPLHTLYIHMYTQTLLFVNRLKRARSITAEISLTFLPID